MSANEDPNAAANNLAAELKREKLIAMATQEMEYKVELFNKLTETCFHKCVDKRYKEGELNLGETSCVDRCVSKFSQVTNMVGHILASGRTAV